MFFDASHDKMIDATEIEGSLRYKLRAQHLLLLPQRAVYWQEQQLLMLADLHLGKAGHFRKAGIPIPSQVHHHDLLQLQELIRQLAPTQVIILGDLFHSAYNTEWADFMQLLENNDSLPFTLVKGNHDILPQAAYGAKNLAIAEDTLYMPPFCFSHKPCFDIPDVQNKNAFLDVRPLPGYNLAGHLHPGASLRDKIGHVHKVPGFYFCAAGGVLPAFGAFTGYKSLKKTSKNHVFGIFPTSQSQHKVLPVS